MREAAKKALTRKEAERQMAAVLSAFKQGLGERLVAVVLFGSRARGEAEETSDWDLLLVTRDLPQKPFQRHLHLKRILSDDWRGRVAILAKTPQEFESHLPSLLLDVALDGVVLHDTNDYVAERLARLRRFMEKQGLRRKRVKRDLIWQWQRFPGFDWSLDWEQVLP